MSKTKRLQKRQAPAAPAIPAGSLSVLNAGAGDIQVTFNDHDDAEVERAIKMLEDMKRRGYAILVRQEDGTYARAHGIDRATKSYVVMVPDTPAAPEPPVEASADAEIAAPAPKRGRGRGRPRHQPIRTSKAVGVARSAGG